jgi:hypothetical protein
MSENTHGGNADQNKANNGKKAATAKPDGATSSNVTGNGADNVVQFKQEGLTLDKLRKATMLGTAITPLQPTPTAVVIDVRKPTKAPLRAHPDPDYTAQGFVLSVKNEKGVGETLYLLDPDVAALIPRHVRVMQMTLCFDAWTRKPFIWPITVLDEGGKGNSWITSAMRVLEAAKLDWKCCISGGGAYELHKPIVEVKAELVWPAQPFLELLLMGFKDCYIDDPNHPEIRKRLTVLIPE